MESVTEEALQEEIRAEISKLQERAEMIYVSPLEPGDDGRTERSVLQELEGVRELIKLVREAVELGITSCGASGTGGGHSVHGDCPYTWDREQFFSRKWPEGLASIPG